MKTIGIALLLVGASGFALAGPNRVPEIDPSAAVGGLVLLSGALLVFRARRKK
jgi:LPXTG-motif cell wall-anchored protein